jgi:hypothetical protein
MTDPASPRYLVRRGIRDWMVWDRQTRSPAMLRGTPAIGLTEERAHEIRNELTIRFVSEEPKAPKDR